LMIAYKKDRVSGYQYGATCSKTKPKLISDVENLPKKYLQKEITFSVKKDELYNALSEGKKVKGAQLEDVYMLRMGVSKG